MDYQKGNQNKGHHESTVISHKEDHGSQPNPLVQLDPGLFIWTIITFLILLSVLAKFAWRPLLQALKDREDDIRSSLEDAEKARHELERLNDESEKIIAKARLEAQDIRSDAKVSAEKIKADLRNQAEKDAKKLKDDAQAQIEVEKDKAISEIRQEVVSLTMSVAEKVIGKNLSSEDNQKLIEKSIKNLREYEA
ncbi:MAG: ATP synthase F0 subunit B [Candidatus Marinimicrobia bacterium]|nr:ATP synthase F0 subunit B [Candidatus Neomarinimicrobiota bacterium]|tara:strand:+ start:3148 stop:3729 length:582 start_codon:yes stop_codon:yes gene_type:complete